MYNFCSLNFVIPAYILHLYLREERTLSLQRRDLTRRGFGEASSWLRGYIPKFKAEREASCVSLYLENEDVPGGENLLPVATAHFNRWMDGWMESKTLFSPSFLLSLPFFCSYLVHCFPHRYALSCFLWGFFLIFDEDLLKVAYSAKFT